MKFKNLLTLILFTVILSCNEEEQEILPTVQSPENLVVSKGEYTNKIILNWNGVPEALNYQVYRYDSLNQEYLNIAEVSENTFTDTTIFEPERKFYYRVRVFNSEKKFSDFSNYDYGFIIEEYESNLSVPNNIICSKGIYVEKIEIAWDISPEAENYEVFKYSSESDQYIKIGETVSNLYNDYEISQAENNLYYKVRIFNSESEYSELSNYDYGFTAHFNPPHIEASSGLFESKIQLTWKNSIGADEYQIFRSESESGEFTEIYYTTDTVYYDTDIESSKIYYYKIKAKNNYLGYSDFSDYDSGHRLESYTLLKSFGTYGMATGQISHPIGVVVDSEDNIYVSENWDSRRVQKFDFNGNYLSTITTGDNPYGILYYQDSLFISKNTPGKIYCFNMAGEIIYDWGNGYGTDLDQFKGVWSMTFDAVHNMYIADVGNGRIKKYNANKELITVWDGFDYPYGLLYINDQLLISDADGLYVYDLNGNLKSLIEFQDHINCIVKDNSGNIYLACSKQIIKMDSQYRITAKIGSFDGVKGICVGENNNLYVSDQSAHKIYIYSPEN